VEKPRGFLTLVKDCGTHEPHDAPMIAVSPSVANAANAATGSHTQDRIQADVAVPPLTRQWTWLAVMSLVVAGLLSLAVVVGRLPWVSPFITDPLFFKRCLVVHVDLALLVWFYSFIAGLAALRAPQHGQTTGRVAWWAAAMGVLGLLGGAVMPGAASVLSNYIPVIDHPLFMGGLGLFFGGILLCLIQVVLAPTAPRAGGLPEDAAIGLLTSCLAVALAATTWVSARAGLPEGLDRWTDAEFSAWGAGHVLQVANVSAMLAVWLWLIDRATGRSVLEAKWARRLFTALLAPHFAMPLLTWRGSLNQLYIDGATTLMRWGIFPVVVILLVASLRHLRRHRAAVDSPAARLAVAGFQASVALTVLGILLGAAIRGSTTLIPAHYHASLGAVTAAFMAGAYVLVEAVARDRGRLATLDRLWRPARRQILLFGFGQSVFALGFGLGGLYGLGRKAYASEQVVRSAGELTGLVVMGLGGLLAVAAGLWFLTLLIREMRRWGRPVDSVPPHSTRTHAHQ
jgi:hypothetical protein